MKLRALLTLPLALLAACASVPNVRTEVVVVASDLDNMPFAGVDAAGQPIGRDVEMMDEIARMSGVTLEWRRMPFAELMPAVERGDVDAVCATLGITPERMRRMAFTRPYYRTSIAVVVRTGGGEPTTLAGLRGRRVTGGAGTTSERAIRERLTGSTLVTTDDKGASAIERLLAGDVDGAVMDGPAADALVAEHPGVLVRLDQDLDRELYGIAIDPRRDDLLRAWNHVLFELECDDWLEELDARHGVPSATSRSMGRSMGRSTSRSTDRSTHRPTGRSTGGQR